MPGDPLILPENDFADAQFDQDVGISPRTLLLILSTPRSGSTLACNILHQAGICTAHEYFQPAQIRPAMMHRWGLAEGDDAGYCATLARYRTSSSGVLGVNLHSYHLKHFERARLCLPDTIRKVRYIWVSRRDKVAQAVSYEIASQTGQWSSYFNKTRDPDYNCDNILRRLRFLQGADRTIRRYLWRRGQFMRPLLYEDIVSDHNLVLKAAGSDARVSRPPAILKQGGTVNAEMIARFRQDHSFWDDVRHLGRRLGLSSHDRGVR